MRNITRLAFDAFVCKKPFTLSNTAVRIINNNPHLYLFDNLIVKEIKGQIFINNGGWNSNTTRERLQPFVKTIRRKENKFIINEKLAWDGDWLNITELNEKK